MIQGRCYNCTFLIGKFGHGLYLSTRLPLRAATSIVFNKHQSILVIANWILYWLLLLLLRHLKWENCGYGGVGGGGVLGLDGGKPSAHPSRVTIWSNALPQICNSKSFLPEAKNPVWNTDLFSFFPEQNPSSSPPHLSFIWAIINITGVWWTTFFPKKYVAWVKQESYAHFC